MTIYRIEDEYGYGPYNAFKIYYWHRRYRWKNQPTPADDFGEEIWQDMYLNQREYIFGFPTLKALNSWFNQSELKRMRKAGFKVKRFAKKPLFKSDKQVVFVRGKAIDIPWTKVIKKKEK